MHAYSVGDFQRQNWVSARLSDSGVCRHADEDDGASSSRQPSSAGAAVPQDVIQAFLQTHQQQLEANQLASVSSIDSVSAVQL
jgi:hypothetical protein